MTVAQSCPNCGESLREGASSCPQCGVTLAVCANCGGLLMSTDRFCPRCGRSRDGGVSAEEDYSSIVWAEVLERLREATRDEFEVLREIGRGGMAAVFLARDLHLARPVAIKVMAPGLLTGKGMVERFRQEAKTVANLNHPHIITIHTVRQAAGLHYFVMKLISGRSLEKILATNGALPLAVVQGVLFQVGSALGYAHRRGIIHRDVKPANILMDEDGNAVVTDFGIAKVVEAVGSTQTGATIGTPPYMSPEQCWSRDVTYASDQYSLGIVAYELLTGKPPFWGPALAVMRAHTEDSPPPIRSARPDCPAEVETAIMRMLEKQPERRWPTVVGAVSALGCRTLSDGDPAREFLAKLAHRAPSEDQLRDAGDWKSPVPSRGPVPPPTAKPGAPTILPPSAIVVRAPAGVTQVGESMRMEAGSKASDGRDLPPYPVTWSSSDPSIAQVSPSGLVQALRPGAVTITARTVEGVSGNVVLRITPLPASSIEVRATRQRLFPGESIDLRAEPRDTAGQPVSDGHVAWSSSDSAIAQVSASGRVWALQPGRATIVATSEAGVRGSLVITVEPPAAATIEIAPLERSPYVGERARLMALVRDARGEALTERVVEWSSSTPRVAQVDSSGTLSALSAGEAKVTARCEGQTASLQVRVLAIPVSRVAVAGPSEPLPVGRKLRLEATCFDQEGRSLAGRPVTWSSSDSAVATVDRRGVVRGVAEGSVSIAAECEGVRGNVPVVVAPAPVSVPVRVPTWAWLVPVVVLAAVVGRWAWHRREEIPVAPVVGAVSVVPREARIALGDSLRLRALALDTSGAAIPEIELAWRSELPELATVSPEGVVVARKVGRLLIRASAGSASGTATILVIRGATVVAEVEISEAPASMAVRDSFQLIATPRDSSGDAVAAGVAWRSSQPTVARVSSTGLVTTVAPGEATITATSGSQEASVRFTVKDLTVALVKVFPPSVRLKLSDSIRFRAEVLGSDNRPVGAGASVTWQADPKVVRISADGMAHAVGPGAALVTATSGGIRGTATLTVIPEEERIAVAKVQLLPAPYSVRVGDRLRLEALARGAGNQRLPDRAITWTSGDSRIATVDDGGMVVALSPGRVQITASSEGQSANTILSVLGPDTTSTGGGGAGGGGSTSTAATFTAVGAGGGLTCGVRTGGALFCWGNGTLVASPVGNQPLRSISLGIAFGCGVGPGDKAYCWGDNGKGQLGNGSSKDAASPLLVSEDISFKEVSAGDLHVCGLSTGGNIFCWGDNSGGQLGEGSKDRRLRPTQIRGSQRWRQVTAGGTHTCALNTDDQAFCWGDGFSGALGQGMMQSELEPVPARGGLRYTGITAGRRHTCGVTPSGEAYCWGDNSDGQLGNGSTEDSAQPVQVGGDITFRALSAGTGHTCGVSAAGQIYCWGNNQSGQLGLGSAQSRRAPAAVRSSEVFVQVSAGAFHTCGVTRAGTVLCWGLNSRGQLGDGTKSPRATPSPVVQR